MCYIEMKCLVKNKHTATAIQTIVDITIKGKLENFN